MPLSGFIPVGYAIRPNGCGRYLIPDRAEADMPPGFVSAPKKLTRSIHVPSRCVFDSIDVVWAKPDVAF